MDGVTFYTMINVKLKYRGISMIAVLVSISLCSILFISLSNWTSSQRQQQIRLFQKIQALQIAENQFQRQFLGLPCENNLTQNGIYFQIQCKNQQIEVQFPLGKISL